MSCFHLDSGCTFCATFHFHDSLSWLWDPLGPLSTKFCALLGSIVTTELLPVPLWGCQRFKGAAWGFPYLWHFMWPSLPYYCHYWARKHMLGCCLPGFHMVTDPQHHHELPSSFPTLELTSKWEAFLTSSLPLVLLLTLISLRLPSPTWKVSM